MRPGRAERLVLTGLLGLGAIAPPAQGDERARPVSLVKMPYR